MATEKFYIGTNYGHSSSSCLLNNEGELLFAVEEDRIIKEKHTSKFPINGINLIFDKYQLSKDNALWCEGWNIYRRFLQKGLFHSVKFYKDSAYFKYRLSNEFKRFFSGIKNFRSHGNFKFVGHHLSHAYSLLPFGLPKKSLILVSDTISENESISIYYWDEKMTLIKSFPFPHSLGSFYHQFAYHLGFSGRTAPGKLMALSGLGKPIWVDEFNKLAHVEDCRFSIDLNSYPAFRLKDATTKFCKIAPSSKLKEALLECENDYEKGIDIAASIQEWFSLNSWDLIQKNISSLRNKKKLEINHIGLVGGAALNCQANGFFQRQIKKIDIETITISPWSDDSGTAIGAAVNRFLIDYPKNEIKNVSPFLGPELSAKNFSDNFFESLEKAADAVLNGKLIALVSGRLEFGPRALGGRCIIASAFDKESPLKLNKCKGRLAFMPSAPAVLIEDESLLFQEPGSSNMAWTVRVMESSKAVIPGAIHITNEARLQTVGHEISLLRSLLKVIKQKKGFGIVLLTSLNVSGTTIPIYYNDAKELAREMGLFGILCDAKWERCE